MRGRRVLGPGSSLLFAAMALVTALLIASNAGGRESAEGAQRASSPKAVKLTFLNDAACTVTGRLYGQGLRAKGKRLAVKPGKKKNARLKGPGTLYEWTTGGSCCTDGEGGFLAPTRKNKNAPIAFSCDPDVQTPLGLTSAKFEDGGTLPDVYTCDGNNTSPPLAVQNVPAGTQSFVLIVDDPDAPDATFTHWVLFDVPADQATLNAGFQPGDYGLSGLNDANQTGYFGACSPRGDDPHRYSFRLYALDVATLGLADGATRAAVESALDGHVIDEAELVALFARS